MTNFRRARLCSLCRLCITLDGQRGQTFKRPWNSVNSLLTGETETSRIRSCTCLANPPIGPIIRRDPTFLLNRYSFPDRNRDPADSVESADCTNRSGPVGSPGGPRGGRCWQFGQTLPLTPTCLDFPILADDGLVAIGEPLHAKRDAAHETQDVPPGGSGGRGNLASSGRLRSSPTRSPTGSPRLPTSSLMSLAAPTPAPRKTRLARMAAAALVRIAAARWICLAPPSSCCGGPRAASRRRW